MNNNTFTLNNGAVYTTNATGKYFYVTDDTRFQKRIPRKEYEAAYEQFVKEENERQNATNEFTNIDTLIAETEESNATEAGEEIAAEMLGEEIDMEQELEVEARILEEHVGKKAPKAKKERKPRKSKDIFHTSIAVPGVTLTAKQVSFMLHLPDSNFWEHGLDSSLWTDVLCDEIGGEFSGKPMTVGAMISTLCEKGLAERGKMKVNGKKCTYFQLTESGKMVAKELGL